MQRFRDLDPATRRSFVVGSVLVALPFVVGAVAAYHRGWYPVGDTATQLADTRQVFSSRPPLVGQVNSSVSYGVFSYHPGPVLFYLFAPFVRVLGASAGMLAAATVVKVTALVLTGYAVMRVRGVGQACGVWIAAMVMVVSLGGVAYLYEPFYAIVAIPLLLLFLILCWTVLSGDLRMVPLWVLVGIGLVQASLQFVVVVAVPALLVVADLERQRWRRRRRYVMAEPRIGRRLTVMTIVLSALVCLPPAGEALANRGGNLVNLVKGIQAARAQTHPLGLAVAVKGSVQAMLFLPAKTSSDHLTAFEAVLAAVLAAATVALVVRRWSELHGADRRLLVSAGIAILGSTATVATSPDDGYQLSRLFALSVAMAFVWFAVWSTLVAPLTDRRPRTAPGGRVDKHLAALGVLAIVGAAATVPLPVDAHRQYSVWTFAAVRDLGAQLLPALQGGGTWSGEFNGPRSLFVVDFGLKGYLDSHDIEVDIARSTGLGWDRFRNGFGALRGEFLVVPHFGQTPPPPPWHRAAAFTPRGRVLSSAQASADDAARFAARSHAVLTPHLVSSLPGLLCPQNSFREPCTDQQKAQLDASVRRQLWPARCIDDPTPSCAMADPANRTIAVADLPHWLVAMLYVETYERDYPYRALIGPRPPADLLRKLRETWVEIPVDVYLRPVG